jgi:hypothetical protein
MKARGIIIALIIIAVIVAITYWYMKDVVKFTIKSITPTASMAAGTYALVIAGGTTSKSVPTTWVGRDIWVYTKSLGKVKATVAAVSASGSTITVTTAPLVGPPPAYTWDATDYARIFLKPKL